MHVYRCNRYDAQKKAQELLIHRKDKIAEEYAELERQGRFLHHFERYKGHGQSLEVSSHSRGGSLVLRL